jgi:hypothetical protein
MVAPANRQATEEHDAEKGIRIAVCIERPAIHPEGYSI